MTPSPWAALIMKTLSGFSRSVSCDESASRFGFLTRSTLLSAIHKRMLALARRPRTMRSTSRFSPSAESIDQQDQVGIARAAPGRRDHRAVEPPPRLEDARRIDQQDLRPSWIAMPISRARVVCALALTIATFWPTKRIDQRRLARVGRADHGDEAGAGGSSLIAACSNKAVAAAVSASCLLAPSASLRRRSRIETWTVKRGA